MSKRYTGPVVFVDGVHYPAKKDGGHDLSKPLRVDGDGFRAADEDEPLHNDTHHQADAELPVGGES